MTHTDYPVLTTAFHVIPLAYNGLVSGSFMPVWGLYFACLLCHIFTKYSHMPQLGY